MMVSIIKFFCFLITILPTFLHCRATTGKVEGAEMPGLGLVRDGTACGENMASYILLLLVDDDLFTE